LVDLLRANTDDLGAPGFDATYGYGRLNAYKAVQAALSSVSYDTSPPSVAISYPASGATVAGAIQVQGSATDNVAVTKVEFYVDGQLAGASTLAAFSFGWNTAAVSNGSHTLAVKAYDGAGNVGSASLQVNVNNASPADTTPPTVAITSPANGSTVTGKVTIVASANDTGGVKTVYIYIDDVLRVSDAVAPYSYVWDTKKSGRGAHIVTATAVDNAGNSASASINVPVK